jgi:hypothetical protein
LSWLCGSWLAPGVAASVGADGWRWAVGPAGVSGLFRRGQGCGVCCLEFGRVAVLFDLEGWLIEMTSEAVQAGPGSRDGDRLVPVDVCELGPAQIVVVQDLPCLRVSAGARLLELRTDGSAESERAALRLAFSVWQLANVSHWKRLGRDSGGGAVGSVAGQRHGIPGAAVEEPGGVGWVTATRRPPVRAGTWRRPAP